MTPQVGVDGLAQCAGALAVNQVHHGLAVHHRMVDELVGLHQGLFHSHTQQVDLHAGLALHPLHGCAAGLGLGFAVVCRFFQLVRRFQVAQRHLGFQDACPHLHQAVAVRQAHHGGGLLDIGNDHLLAHLHLLEGHELLDHIMHHVGLAVQALGLLAGDLPGPGGALGSAGLFVLLQLAQLIGETVGLVLHLLGHLAGLQACGLQLGLALLDQCVVFLAGGFQLVFGFGFRLFRLVLAGLQLQLQVVQLGQHAVQPLVVVGQVGLRPLDHPGRYAQLLADQEGVGFARYAHAQLVGGAQALHIELTTGVHHAGSLQREDLHLGIVGSGHDQGALDTQLLDDAHRQRRALGGVGARAQLVQQDQGVFVGVVQNAGDLFHVAREGGQALLDALLVADVHQILTEHADGALLMSRDQQAVLCHGAQKARGFQGNGFTAGVGAGDDQGVVLLAQSHVHRNHLVLVDQGVAGLFQIEPHAVRHLWHVGLLFQRQTGLGQQHVDVQHGLVAEIEHRLDGGHLVGEGGQNALDLAFLLAAQLHDLGVGLHHRRGLHEHGGTAGGHVVDDAAHFAPVLSLDRHHEAAVTQRDHRVLQKLIGGAVFDDGIQLVPDGIFHCPDLAPDVKQGVAGGVRHFLRRQNRAGDVLFQSGLGGQGIEQIIHRQHVVLGDVIPADQVLEVAQRTGHLQQLRHREDTAFQRPVHHLVHTLHPAKARAAVFQQQSIDGIGLGEGVAHLFHGLEGVLLQQQSARLRADRKLGCPIQNLFQLQRFQITFFHGLLLITISKKTALRSAEHGMHKI